MKFSTKENKIKYTKNNFQARKVSELEVSKLEWDNWRMFERVYSFFLQGK